MDVLSWISLLSTLLFVLLGFRWVRHTNMWKSSKRRAEERRALIVLGSGGHTAEMLKLMDAVCSRCPIRSYIVADEMSQKRALEFERTKGNKNADISAITRSREVGQSFSTSVLTTLKALAKSFSLVWSTGPDVVLCNGPGTCVPVCVVAFLLDLIFFINCRLIYVESVCRVHTLSLSGKLLYHSRLCDGFLVQWPELKKKYARTTYLGRFL